MDGHLNLARLHLYPDQFADLGSHYIEGYAHEAVKAGDVGHFHVPLISHITGNLYVGGCQDGVRISDDFVYVVSLYQHERYRTGPNTNHVDFRLIDGPALPEQALLDQAVGIVRTWLERGPVLVHCQAGLNRSNLIAALTLRELGYSSADAIALLREKRSPVVLCNRTFASYLLSLDSQEEPTPT